MNHSYLEKKAAQHLKTLCHQIPNRRLGAAGNRQATTWFAENMAAFGFAVETPAFDCLDWEDHGAHLLTTSGETFEIFNSPYTHPCQVTAPLVAADTADALSQANVENSILLLHGNLAAEQLMPKKFPFYNPQHHQDIYQLLESKAPLAILTATGRNPELAGGMYPFPMIEDGDFDLPSAYLKDVDGEQLLSFVGQPLRLTIESARIPAVGHNVIARKPADSGPRLLFCAHIDAKDNTPGALDNGTGVVVLLLLAELLQDYSGKFPVELLALNGEDHYSAQGHKHYLATQTERINEIFLAVNTDVAGYTGARSAYSLYGCAEPIAEAIRAAMSAYPSIKEGPQWYQSDHSVFIQQGRPAVAITSENFMELSTNITHTSKDDLNLVDFTKMADIVLALYAMIGRLNQMN